MEIEQDIVIVGAGISGLATSLGLYRLGYRSLILESSTSLRSTGFALTQWTNAWRALDVLGIGDSLREQHLLINGNIATSVTSGVTTSEVSFTAKSKFGGDHEIRCVKRVALLEALKNELPAGTIKFSSKVVNIGESGNFKLLYLVDGTVIKTKVLIGCDGVNSVVAKWLGLKKPSFSGRSALRGYTSFNENHGFGANFHQFFGEGVRSGFIPCSQTTVYWFITYTSSQVKEIEDDPLKMKQLMISKLGKGADNMKHVMENSELASITSAPLRFRHPWDLLFGKISRENVCVAGDALHPMTPDIGQGGCAALEDGVTLARCIAEALSIKSVDEKKEFDDIKMGLKKYANERKWRSFDLIATSYMVGAVQQTKWKVLAFLRDRFMSNYLAGLLLKKADFDCGKLDISGHSHVL